MSKKVSKGDIVPFNGILYANKEAEKIQKDIEILNKIDNLVRIQTNGYWLINKNN